MRIEIARKIEACSGKGILNLSNMAIRDDEIFEIVIRITKYSHIITSLNLDNNDLTDEGATILGEELRECYKLQKLSVQFNNIGEKGATALFSLKRELPDLMSIAFHGNKITDVGKMAEIEQAATQTSQDTGMKS